MLNFVSVEKFHFLAGENRVTHETAIRSQCINKVEVSDDNKRELLFTISTDSIDRAGDKINQAGWDFDSYRKNPVVLWAHEYSKPPVATSDKIWIEGGRTKSLTRFVPADNPAVGRFAEGVYQLYKGGFMSASSVGFLPKKWNFTEDKDRKFGIDFEEQELLEFSLVPVPANAEALIEARSMGIDLGPIRDWAMDILKADLEPKTLRDYENFLREAGGFSRKDASWLASHGWREADQREADPDLTPLAMMIEQALKI